MCRSFPLRWCAKPAFLVLVLILAGCGGGGTTEPSTQTVQGAGYRFEAPTGWEVKQMPDGVAAASGPGDRVEVRTFKLVRPYVVSRFAAAVRELDNAITRLAAQQNARVTSRRTARVAGRKVRSYRIAYDDKVEEITWLLVGRQEHQLLCRRRENGDDQPCRQLLDTFGLR